MAPLKPASPSSEQLFALAVGHHRHGRLAEAENLYRQFLANNPKHPQGLHLAGVAALQRGQHQIASELIEKSLSFNDSNAQAHYHLGLAKAALGRFDETAEQNRRAISLQPDYADAHMNLGNALKELGQLDEAAASYQRAIEINPDLAAAHYNLANVLVAKRDFDRAIKMFERALHLQPTYLQARQNLATALLMQERLDEADEQFKAVLAAKPGVTEALLGRATILTRKGHPEEALAFFLRHTLDHNPTADVKLMFVECVKTLPRYPPNAGLENYLVAAITEPWTQPRDLAAIAAQALRTMDSVANIRTRLAAADDDIRLALSDLEALATNRLLLAVLENAAVVDPELESGMTAARRALLALTTDQPDAASDSILGFACALARQCFINEYVFEITEDENTRAHALGARLSGALDAGETPPALMVAVTAAYFPLNETADADRLLAQEWPSAVDALLTQQLREPRRELELRASLPQLTPIEDDVSLKVQRQYEENPYPRWIKMARLQNAVPLDDYIRRMLPRAPLRPTGKSVCDVLNAGCGTGRQSLSLAFNIADARILAIDLSRASLSHAQRKTLEFGIKNIEYAQADILKLSTLDRTFDVVVSSGVLHHLADPFAAWRSLLASVRPGGVMMIALYSKTATPHVLAARALVAAEGYQGTPEGIRRARRAILALPDDALVKQVTNMADFYSTSECRDLFFHVQEQRLTIPQLKEFIDETGLQFLGFNVPPQVAERYLARFPQDPTMTELNNWSLFETDNPLTFVSMYDFVVQKPTTTELSSAPLS